MLIQRSSSRSPRNARLLPKPTWIVTGGDYPLSTADALQQLMQEHQHPVNCYDDLAGHAKLTLGIWSPEALVKLEDVVAEGKLVSSSVVRGMDNRIVEPTVFRWTLDANTPGHWADLMEKASAAHH